jgi:hypothetical protein
MQFDFLLSALVRISHSCSGFSLENWRAQDEAACIVHDSHLGVQFAFSLDALFAFADFDISK